MPDSFVAWTSMCEFIPTHIDWLVEVRADAKPSNRWVNYSIVIHTASMIEGAIELLIRQEIRENLGKSLEYELTEDEFNERIVKNFESQIIKAGGWDSIKKIFKTLRGSSIADEVDDQETMRAISVLFKLRNASVAHGRALNSIGPNEFGEFIWESNNLVDVEKYLIEKELMEKPPAGEYKEPLDFFTDEIADHLYRNALKLAVKLEMSPTTPHSLPSQRTADIITELRNEN